jgi:hypothetical protein
LSVAFGVRLDGIHGLRLGNGTGKGFMAHERATAIDIGALVVTFFGGCGDIA